MNSVRRLKVVEMRVLLLIQRADDTLAILIYIHNESQAEKKQSHRERLYSQIVVDAVSLIPNSRVG